MPDPEDHFRLDQVEPPPPPEVNVTSEVVMLPEKGATAPAAPSGAPTAAARDPLEAPVMGASVLPKTVQEKMDMRNHFASIPDAMASGEPCNVTITRPMTSDKETPAVETLRMPSADVQQHKDLLARFPNMTKNVSPSDADWLATFIDGLRMISSNRQYQASLTREGSDWRQGLEDDGSIIRSQIPRFTRPAGQALTGSDAVRHAVAYLGMGDVFSAAMWHSGFWVTFSPAPEIAWLELNRLLASDEVRLGRDSYGLAHSGMTALAQETIVRYITQFVYSTSVKANEMPIADIPKYLSSHDVNAFIWAFVVANFPHGFNIERACIVDPTTCRHKNEETLEMTELQVVDNTVFDVAMRTHMRKRQQGSVPLQAVIDYQERVASCAPQTVEVKTGSQKVIKMTLAPPTADKAFDMAHNHVDMVVQAVQRTVTAETSVRERHMSLNDYFTATEMCIYQHWIKSIEFNDNIVENESDIQELLGAFTKDPVLRASYLDAISAYIDKSVISVIGLSTMVCGGCGKSHTRESKLRPELQDVVPFDITHVFLLLAEFKSQVIRARAG